jgi:hypothetical protein
MKAVDIDRVYAKRGGFKARPRRDDEHQQQKALIEWARLNEKREPRLKLLYAIPNGRKRSKAEAGKLKAEGVKAGVPDLCLACGHGLAFNAMYFEFKSPTGRLSKDQIEMHALLRAQGNCVEVYRDWVFAASTICAYFNRPDLAEGL